ncbi:MAG: winged helix-turn-helix domain-containing protein [Candidatus Bathyarchaeota archaeon]|nr:winged helix-turn-helix domain-containing protein [Candidatus Bathyarchaeota archaeon]
MVGRRRSRLKVAADILAEALNGANKTRIMYRANLNFLRFDRYFSELMDKGLIVEENTSDGRATYRTTDKGKRFLKIISDAEEIISS